MRRRRPAHELRTAIDCLPIASRKAMLDGIDSNRIIVGAYVDRHGGVCPMLAAHRHGGRTSLGSFARAWDRYTRANRPRPASEREVRTLRTMLEASVVIEEHGGSEQLREAVAAHRAAAGRRRAEPPRDTGERDRTSELRDRPGWAWSRLFRRYDQYEIALRQLEALREEDAASEPEEREGALV